MITERPRIISEDAMTMVMSGDGYHESVLKKELPFSNSTSTQRKGMTLLLQTTEIAQDS